MNIYTKEFWEKVQKEYNCYDGTTLLGICSRSDTFADEWRLDGRRKIDEIGKEFLFSKWWKFRWMRWKVCKSAFLFEHRFLASHSQEVNIRKSFIKWCIKKFK